MLCYKLSYYTILYKDPQRECDFAWCLPMLDSRNSFASMRGDVLVSLLGATDCTPEIDTSEIMLDFQWHFPMDFEWQFPTNCHISVALS